MAVSYVKELWSGRTGSDTYDKRRQYARFYEVRTTAAADDVVTAGGTPLLPRLRDAYPSDASALVVRIVPTQRDEDPTLWTVSVEYDTELPRPAANEIGTVDGNGNIAPAEGDEPGSPPARSETPTDRPASYRVTHEQITEPIETDYLGVAIQNSAKLPFDPPLTREVSYPVITVTKNYPMGSISLPLVEQYVDAMNDARWRGIAAKKCRITAFDYESVYENGLAFIRATIQVKVRWKGWDARPVDRGFYELVKVSTVEGGGDRLDRIKDLRTGSYPDEPSLLDGKGARLPPGKDPVVLPPFQIYRSVSFAALGI